jgi:lysophospholipid acyltransferase (LPLAT)-like uncharacterized protein
MEQGDLKIRKEPVDVAQRLDEISRLVAHLDSSATRLAKQGRNWWTRSIDVAITAVRHYLPPLHWIGATVLAVCFYVYARLCALTVRLSTAGVYQWPEIPDPCVLSVWHGGVNSLIVAIAARKPSRPLAILIAGDPRGDCLSFLCRLLGLRVVRIAGRDGGWRALARLAHEIKQGACAIITADGGGPAHLAKAGAVALSSVTATPILAVGTHCHPAIGMPHKWDAARTPIPFGRVAVSIHGSCYCPEFTDRLSVDDARLRLQHELSEAARDARQII